MDNKKGTSQVPLNSDYSCQVYVCGVVAATLAAQELDHLKALEMLPTPALLAERLRGRTTDFFMMVGVVAAFLKAQEVDR